MKRMTKAELRDLQQSGATVRTVEKAKAPEASPPAPDQSASFERLAKLQESMVRALEELAAAKQKQPALTKPRGFEFIIERNSRGLMQKVTAKVVDNA